MLVYLFEFYFLGPYSFIELSQEGNLNITVENYLAHGYDGGRFTHQFAGGQDIYSILPGAQHLNPNVLLLSILPTWAVLLFHKALIAALGFGGAYLLARRMAPNSRAIAVAVAAVMPFSHEYLLNFGTNWGPGFAAFPLAVYACVVRSREKNYYPWLLFSAVFVAASEPIHVFPALLVAVAGGAILFDAVNLKRVLIGFSIYIFFSILSWHEFIYANFLISGYARRDFGSFEESLSFLQAIYNGLSFYWRTSIPTFFSLAALAVMLFGKDRFFFRALVALSLPFVGFVIAAAFPWHSIGLAFMNKLSHQYMFLAAITLFVPVAARALSQLQERVSDMRILSFSFRPEIAVLAIALSLLTWNKFLNLGILVWFGGQSTYFGYETLKDPQWKPAEDFRVVSLFEKPPTNITAGFYGFDVFDGQVNLPFKPWQDYWFEVMNRDPGFFLISRTGIKWEFWDGEAYDIEKLIRLDFLAIANTRYLFSALPLKSDKLKLVFAPEKEDWTKVRPAFFESSKAFLGHRLKRIFDPGELYIYEIPNSLPRVFAARGVKFIGDSTESKALHDRVAATALTGAIVARERFKGNLSGLGELRLKTYQKVTDGYDVSVDAPEGGILVLNNSYLPYWEAEAGGRRLDIVPVNGVHMAVAVPSGVSNIRIRYKRPLAREKLMRLFQ